MGRRIEPDQVLANAVRMANRRLMYLSQRFPSSKDPAMAKWTPAISKEIQGYIQTLRGAGKEKAHDLQALVNKFAQMENEQLKAALDALKAKDGGDAQT